LREDVAESEARHLHINHSSPWFRSAKIPWCASGFNHGAESALIRVLPEMKDNTLSVLRGAALKRGCGGNNR
jgi:hypothetical protein